MPRKKKHCPACALGTPEVYGHFAAIALATLKADETWGRFVGGLSSLFVGEPENPL